MYAYGQELVAAKRAKPTDDMLSIFANATVDEAPALSDLELYLFFSLLFSAGAETARNPVAGGLLSHFATVCVAAPVEWARSNRHTGIRHLIVKLLGPS